MVVAGAWLVLARPPVPGAVPGWSWAAALPAARGEMKAAGLGHEVFVPGGLRGLGRSSDRLDIYDARTDRWRRGAPMPQPLNHHATVALGGLVYVVGGNRNILGDPPGRFVFRYDPAADDWERRAAMPVGRWGHDAVALDGRIYVLGGTSDEDPNAVLIYDPDADRWTTGAAIPTRREHLGAGVIDGRIYVVGGRWEGKLTGALEIYDPAADAWAAGPPLPTPRSGFAAALVGGRLHVVGGEDPAALRGRVFAANEAYDPIAREWSALAPEPLPRHGAAAAVVDGRLLVIGGAWRQGVWSLFAWSDRVAVYQPAGR